jgi:adenylate kinase family enzyme
MNRVLVIGCSGAGKSVFSRQLSDRTGLPLIHLDQEFWQPGWMPTAPDAWRQHVAALAAEPRWIMDGQFGGTLGLRLRHADTVFVVDMPRWLCLTRVLRRTWRDFGRTRSDMAPGCVERLDWEFLKYIWNYKHTHRLRHQAALEEFGGTVIVLQRPADVDAYLAHLERVGAIMTGQRLSHLRPPDT